MHMEQKAIELSTNEPCGSWALVQAYNKQDDMSTIGKKRRTSSDIHDGKVAAKEHKMSKTTMKKKATAPKEPKNIVKNAGYIMYKD